MPDDTADVRPLLDLVVIDCPDPHALAEFYGAVLGWLVEGGSEDDFVVLSHPEGVGSSRVDLQACKLEYSIVSPK